MGRGKPWTREDVIIAYALYCVIPFSKVNNSNQTIKDAAEVMGRSPASLKMRICNLAALDPDFLATGRAGLTSVANLDREVFAEFSSDWQRLSARNCLAFRFSTLPNPSTMDPTNDTRRPTRKYPRSKRGGFSASRLSPHMRDGVAYPA